MHKIPIAITMAITLTCGLGSAAAVAPAAHAASIDITCTGTETVTYQPGLLLSPQTVQVTVNGDLAPCASSESGITSGAYQEDFSAPLSCATLLAGRSGTRVFQWSNGQTSTFTFTRELNDAGGQTTVTFTGTITSGEFAGDTAVEQVGAVTPSALQCANPPGLTTLGPAPATLTLTGL